MRLERISTVVAHAGECAAYQHPDVVFEESEGAGVSVEIQDVLRDCTQGLRRNVNEWRTSQSTCSMA
jgi:hypothetical protein